MSRQHEWWQHGVIYQIYPRSFQDSDGDGIGDLRGILSRLDYLQWLGVDAIWLSPISPSPMKDFGYDISNYTDIEPLFGTLGDFDQLVAEAHRRGMKVVLDFVPNHTSSEHSWFLESRSSRTNPKRDWYIWRDPAPDGGPLNNWLSNFGGPAWEFDELTGQYYYHAFLREQPDLNWRNPEVQDAMLDVLRFWLDRGVDGFRVDVIWHIVKDDQFRNNLPDPDHKPHHAPHRQLLATYNTDRPEVHDIIARMRGVLDEYQERMMVGEIYLPLERLVTYYGAQGTGVHLPFNFQLIELAWHTRALADAIDRYEALLPSYGWPNWVLGNHDNPRIASRIGSAQARVAAMLLLTLRGTPTLYYGDEIAMQNVPIPPDRVQDPFEKNVPGLGLGRDPSRTPMQWSAAPNAGFTSGSPWLPIAEDFTTRNVEAESADAKSILTLYRRLIQLRREQPALSIGTYTAIPTQGDLLAYRRSFERGRRYLVVLNLSSEPATFQSPVAGVSGRVAVSTHLDREAKPVTEQIELRADEGLLIELTDS
ncbi:MAG TPA: alpha-amylase family glycosyl hydrolase [Lacipirellulaceae bacterium]|nr:alpha-amylase family glycosyl hydrolase [Lacipirellulaceae bacterium]